MAQTIKHSIPAAVKAWIKKEVALQRQLHKKISKEINEDMAPRRVRWYAEFLERIQRPGRGFNVHFTERRVIPDAEMPKQPKRKDKVVW
jgi:hypothetical protein